MVLRVLATGSSGYLEAVMASFLESAGHEIEGLGLGLILPRNLKEEIMSQFSDFSEWGGRFIVPIAEARVFAGAGE